MPTDAVLKKLYSGNYEFRVDRTSLLRFKVVSQKIIEMLKSLQPSGRTLLDIGSGYGTFVEEAISNKLDATGIEPAVNLYSSINPKIQKRVLHTDLNKFLRTNSNKFDFVTAIHVIEHQKDPRKFLATAVKLLKPGGVLYIETPNCDSHLAYFEKANYTFLTPPDHINLFSVRSFQVLLNKVNNIVESKFHTYSYPEHFVGILRTIKRGLADNHLSVEMKSGSRNRSYSEKDNRKRPFFDRVVAPFLTPLLNIGNKGSFIQVYIQK